MIRRWLFLLLIGLAMHGLGTAQAAPRHIRIATNSPYKPMEYTQPDGTLTGFDVDLGNALCRQAKLHCTWVNQSWNGIIPGLISRKYDAIMSTMAITAKRQGAVKFSNPYVKLGSAWFVKKDSAIQTPNRRSLAGKHIGVQRGTLQDDYVTRRYASVAVIKRYANADDVALDLKAGRLDATLITSITGRRLFMAGTPSKFRSIQPVQSIGRDIGIAFRKNEGDLVKKFNQALGALRQNGVYARIHKKYFGSGSPQNQ